MVAPYQDCRRKEPRFKICDGQSLPCQTSVDENTDALKDGSVIDLSTTGIRILCEGSFAVGQEFSTLLAANERQGEFRGVIRRIEPWVGGKSILGCQLLDPIPTELLQELASLGIVNRRIDPRVEMQHEASMSWELHPDEIDIEIQDFSQSGMRVFAQHTIPDNVRLRIRIGDESENAVTIAATSVWRDESDEGCHAGLQFTTRDGHDFVEQLSQTEPVSNPHANKPLIRTEVAVFAAAVVLATSCLEFAMNYERILPWF